MIHFFKSRVQKGQPMSMPGFADGIQAMATALERMRVEGGRVDWSAAGTPTIVFEGAGGEDNGVFVIDELTATSITLGGCALMRGPVYITSADLTASPLSGTDDIMISAKVDTTDNSMTLVSGSPTTGDGVVYDSAPDDTSVFYLRPLYILSRADADSAWDVSQDLRAMPQLGIYV